MAAGSLCILPTFIFDACPGFTSDPAGQFVADVRAAKPIERITRAMRHYHIFGTIDFDISDQIKLIAEGRYINERITLKGPSTIVGSGQQDPFFQGPDFVNVCAFSDCSDPLTLNFDVLRTVNRKYIRKDSYFVHAVRLEWSPTEDTNLYASYSVGKTPGGLATIPLTGLDFGLDPDHDGDPSELEFGTERIRAFELGASGVTFNGDLDFNLAFFYQDIADKQVVSQQLGMDLGGAPVLVPSIDNTAEAEIYGVEVDGTWRVSDKLSVQAAYTWLQSEYQNFTAYSTNASEIAAAGNCTTSSLGGLPTCLIDRSGNDVEGVPEHSFVGSALYRHPFAGDIDWFFQARGRFQSQRFVDASNTVMLDGYWLSDLRLGLSAKQWDIFFYVDNLLNNDTVRSAFSQADVANGEYRVGVCAITPLCSAFAPVVDPNIPIATVANLPDPRTWGRPRTRSFLTAVICKGRG